MTNAFSRAGVCLSLSIVFSVVAGLIASIALTSYNPGAAPIFVIIFVLTSLVLLLVSISSATEGLKMLGIAVMDVQVRLKGEGEGQEPQEPQDIEAAQEREAELPEAL